jgi:DNA (cytosine-5)-methyltransferase 1
MKVLDLFSGIGGFSLGLERAGFTTAAFCEIEPYCQAVLRKHWPDVPIYDDIRKLTIGRLAADGISVDVICGGFPCQDISVAGKGEGIEGERSGLWSEYARLIGELRPSYAIVENVSALLSRGMDTVLGDLASLGYDAEWHCIPASAVGAPHRRDRVWIVAYPNCGRGWSDAAGRHNADREDAGWTQADGLPRAIRQASAQRHVANANSRDEQRWRRPLQMGWGRFASEAIADGDAGRAEWGAEPSVGRVAHGIPRRVDRLGGLGNAVVPKVPEIIGRAIMKVA